MAGSVFGKYFTVTTWGESHGPALGAVVDGCPAGLPLSENDIQIYLNRRKPGASALSTPRKEDDLAHILSGVFEGKTTGAPISLLIENTSQRSADYSQLADCYRPGLADYCYDQKYGFRDYRGGGRSSGRETAARVAAGAIAAKLLSALGIRLCAFTKSIGPVEIDPAHFDAGAILETAAAMPDREAAARAEQYLSDCRERKDSAGGVVECSITGLPAGIGEPVFDKLDARLAEAVMSIGAVKAVEIGDGCRAASANGSANNDAFYRKKDGRVGTRTNHAGGILGGISDGEPILLRAYIKPTPSIFTAQETVSRKGEPVNLTIRGRHDPVIVPRAVVVVECMCALTVADLLFANMHATLDGVLRFYRPETRL